MTDRELPPGIIPWMVVIDEELVNLHLGVANLDDDYHTAKNKMKNLINTHQSIWEYFQKDKGDVQ